MNIPFLSQLTRRVGIDLGTGNTRIWSDKLGVVVNEPSCVAVDERTKKVVAVGSEALAMSGRVGHTIKIYRPLANGILQDAEIARVMLKFFLQKVFRSSYFFRPLIMVSVPSTSTESNRQAVTELMYSVGAREVFTISQSLAAAIGAGVPIADASGTFLLQLGSGQVEASVLSLGSQVISEATDKAGMYADAKIKQVVKTQLSLVISTETAERLKKTVGAVMITSDRSQLASGQDVVSTSPKELSVSSHDLLPPLIQLAEQYEKLLKKVLSRIQPELTADVIDKGMLLAGGLAQLQGLDHYLVSQLGIPVSVVEEPDQAVIKGISVALENIELFAESLGYQQ